MDQAITASERLEPLKSVLDLFEWSSCSRESDAHSRCSVHIPKTRTSRDQRLLACHDLQGGYGDDSLIRGGKDAMQFTLHYWHLIDVFVYFSHNLVTIPPPSWTSAAHQHGVQVLGTFITEWEDGKASCQQIFCNRQSAERAAQQLVAIALYFHFEGWLINIENGLDLEDIPNLLHFLRELHRMMHEANHNALVIWYDAITSEGKLQWQDNLTELNHAFFDACDGLFVNYTWKAGTPALAAKAAEGRAKDIFMGVDVFGRNTYGGGGMKSHIAMEAAYSAGLSCALFAPGWVWETASPRKGWRDKSDGFWDLLSTADAAFRVPRPIVTTLPFVSSFSRGCGLSSYTQGILASPEPWYCLAKQDIQPIFQETFLLKMHLSFISSSLGCQKIRICLAWLQAAVQDGPAYSGGQTLCLTGKLWQGQELVLPLFTAAYASASDLSGSIHMQILAGCHMALALRLGQQGEVKTAGHPDASQIPFGAPDSWRQWQDLKPQCIRKESIAIAGPMLRGQDIQKLPGTTQKSVGAGDPVSMSLMPHEYAPNREDLMGGVVKWVQREGHFSGLKGATVTAIGVYCTSTREDGYFSAKIGQISLQPQTGINSQEAGVS